MTAVVEPLTHVPPDVAFDKAEVKPAHADSVPVIAAGLGLTVMVVVVLQPVFSV